ncbi:MAG: HigA family addiction module antitoxin [Cyclobacteriaceae bacterium]
MSNNRKIANDLLPGSSTHPGVLLREELSARDMKQIELAKKLGVAKNVMSEIVNGRRNISPELAVRLENALSIKAEFWMRYQTAYDIDKIRMSNGEAQKAQASLNNKTQPAPI